MPGRLRDQLPTMRVSLRKTLQWMFCLAVVQVVIYYWATRKTHSYMYNIQEHRVLESVKHWDGTCAYSTCPAVKEEEINVHIIPHSHIDVGWVKSVEQYYVGEMVPGVWATGCVRCTFNATILQLLKDKSRRFVLVEMKYLSRYWDEIDDKQRGVILQLIKERRLEIINGGWVMSDAAVTMYNDIIDQHTLGFDFIREKLGSCAQPRIGWHVDQFGHSREHASIFAQMGFESLFIGRIDFLDLMERVAEKSMEMVWMTSPKNLKVKSHLFTHILYDGYTSPLNFNFETQSYNWKDTQVAEKTASEFMEILKQRIKGYKTNHLLLPMGCDFGYQDAYNWFVNMDSLVKAVNKLQRNSSVKYNFLYSTPSCYTYHINKKKVKFPVKFDDFHPYGIEPGAYWTGYFTTRGGFKRHIKRAGQILQSCKQLYIFTDQEDMFGSVNKLRDAMAVVQHHDAITGTQTAAVLKDYNAILSNATRHCEIVMSQAYAKILKQDEGYDKKISPLSWTFCHDLNISSCAVSEGSRPFLTTLYNPLSWSVNIPVRLPVKAEQVAIVDANKKNVNVQLVPVPEMVTLIPERVTNPPLEAVFNAHLPAMSAVSFTVKPQPGNGQAMPALNATFNGVIQNEYLQLKFDKKTGRLKSMYNKVRKVAVQISQDFAYYISDDTKPRTSGAYLFVPLQSGAISVTQQKVEIKVVKGEIVQEVHQRFSDWVSQVVRLYKGAKYAEFQWVVGSQDNPISVEVISRFTSDIKSGNSFFTDSNGREMLMRIRRTGQNKTKVLDPISGNYYPVTSRIFIQDDDKDTQLTILPDRPQGGSSLSSGSLELMVHRRIVTDDSLGIGEPVVDNGADGKGIIYTGKHYVCLDNVEKSALLVKHLALQLHLAPVPMFAPLDDDRYASRAPKQHNFLHSPLPDNVQILTLDRISENESDFFIIRLEHVFEEKEERTLSAPVTVSLENLFRPFRIAHIEESTLGGNFRPSEIHRFTWETTRGATLPIISSYDYKTTRDPPFTIILRPMEIRTFRIQIVWQEGPRSGV